MVEDTNDGEFVVPSPDGDKARPNAGPVTVGSFRYRFSDQSQQVRGGLRNRGIDRIRVRDADVDRLAVRRDDRPSPRALLQIAQRPRCVQRAVAEGSVGAELAQLERARGRGLRVGGNRKGNRAQHEAETGQDRELSHGATPYRPHDAAA